MASWQELVDEGAPVIFGVLTNAVKRRGMISYDDLAKELRSHTRFKTAYRRSMGGVVGTFMETIWRACGTRVPPINAVVGGKWSRLPGEGVTQFLGRFGGRATRYKELSDEEKREVLRPIWGAIYDYPRWNWVARKTFGIKRINEVDVETDVEHPSAAFAGGGPESDAHKSLKRFVACHPRRFGAPLDVREGILEFPFDSGDRADIAFDGRASITFVEVKARNVPEAEFERGVFQAAKYRALSRIQDRSLEMKPRPVRVFLVTDTQLPSRASVLAKRLKVTWHGVDRKEIDAFTRKEALKDRNHP